MEKRDGILYHYIRRFQGMTFDEYDVMGFLIAIRDANLRNNQPELYDFSNIIAHRDRDRGIAVDSMSEAIKNDFCQNANGEVLGFNGPKYNKLRNQIEQIGIQYQFITSEVFINDFILCLMSIAQHVVCEQGGNEVCKLELFQKKDHTMALVAIGEKASVCYLCNQRACDFEHKYPGGYIQDAIEMIRIEGNLKAYFCDSGLPV